MTPDVNQNRQDKEFNTMGFDSSKSRRSLFYILFSTLLGIIFLLARQVTIERKLTKAAEDSKSQMQDEMNQRLYKLVEERMREPTNQIKEAIINVDSATSKVKSIAEKLENKTKK